MNSSYFDTSDLKVTKALWLVLGFALLIRLIGITYGLPFIYWVDDYHEVMRAIELGAGEFNLLSTRKGGLYYLLFVEYGFYFVALKLSGAIASTKEFAQVFVRDPSMFYLMGRVTTVIFGSATVLAVYAFARRAYLAPAALLAAIVLAVNALHVDLSHRVNVDVLMSLLAVVSLCYALRITVDGKRRDYLLAGLFAGLAATTKITAILLLLPLLIAHGYYVAGKGGRLRLFIASRDLWLAALVFVAVLVATNPGILIDTSLTSLFSSSDGDLSADDALEAMDEIRAVARPNLYLFYLGILQASMGWPLFGVALASVGYAAWKRTAADVILLSYLLVNYLAIASTTSATLFYPRYTAPIIVVLAILAGRALADILRAIPRRRLLASTLVVAVLIAFPLTQVFKDEYTLTREDTRTLARDWFNAHVPVGSKVLIEGSKTAASRLTVPLDDSLPSLDRRIAYWTLKEPRQAKHLQVQRSVHGGGGFELELVRILSVEDLDTYAKRGIEYYVVRPDFFLGSRQAESSSVKLLHALRTDPRVKLLQRFDNEHGNRPGPVIEVYRLVPDATAAR